jgi:hypothetical protein
MPLLFAIPAICIRLEVEFDFTKTRSPARTASSADPTLMTGACAFTSTGAGNM